MNFKWDGRTRRRWRIWEGVGDLIKYLESLDGPMPTREWFLAELETIGELGMSQHFLELARSGKKYGNPNHSSVAYFMGFTDEEPRKPPVGMEVSEFRNEMPDIDLDFEDRDRAIAYTRDKYGIERTAYIGTFGQMRAKKAVRDVCRVLDFPYELGDAISKAMPPSVFGVPPTLEECFKSKEFAEIYETNADAKTVVDAAKNLEGLYRDTSTHASGFVIGDAPITDYVPVMQDGPDAPVRTQWDMRQVEKAGLLKIDFLGLINLEIIHDTVRNVKANRDIDVGDPYRFLDEPDDVVFKALSRGDSSTVFQLESGGMVDLMISLKPTSLNDVAALLALYRPGPMESNVHNEYAARKNGRKPVTYAHSSLEPILKDTYGLLIYQEQLLAIAQRVAGMNLMEADNLRKIVGKKLVDKMPAQRAGFVNGCVDTAGMPRPVAEKLFDEIEHHASYSFGAGHAFGYSFISYITSYLKNVYPTEYMAATLSAWNQKPEKLREYLKESHRMGIKVERPDINDSKNEFTIKDDRVVYGLDGIAGLGGVSVKNIVDSQDSEKPYTSIYDFFQRAHPGTLNRKIIEKLLKSGAFDKLDAGVQSLELNRNAKVAVLFNENDQLGVFLGSHPFLDLKDLIVEKVTHGLGGLHLGTENQTVRVAGIITKIEKKNTRAGKRMFVLEIEDDQAKMEVVIFAKAADELGESPFSKGELIVFTGKVRADNISKGDDEGEDTAKLSLVFIDMEKVDYGSVTTESPIYLHSSKPMSFDILNQIKGIMKKSHGPSPVLLEIPLDSGKKVTVRFEHTVDSNLGSTLQKLLEV